MRHKNIALFALSAALLLSGCNTDKAVTTTDTSAVTEEVTTTEATTTTTTATTTTSTTTAAPEPEKTYGIIPKEADGVFEITAEPLLDIKAIGERYGYDIDYDFENDPKYPDIAKSYEERHTEEELADIRDIHYLGRYDIVQNAHYISNEIADWLVELSWGYYNAQLASFEKFLFIKDGETVLETEIIPMNICAGEWIYGDTLFFSTSANGIFQLDLLTGEYGFLSGDNWEDIADIDDDYVIYGNGELMIYDRHSRELITPTVPLGYCPMPGEPQIMELDRGRVIYDKPEEPGVLYYYDIKGECSGRLTGEYSPRSYRAESDEYSAVEICDDEDGLVAVEITRKSDGLTKTFDLTHLPHKYETMYLKTERSFFCGSWFLPDIMGVEAVAIDFDTEEYLPVEKNGYYEFDISRIYMKQVGSRLYGRYIDTDGEWAFGALDMTVFRENRNSDPKPPQREGVTYFLTDHIAGTAGYIGCGSDPAEVGRTPLYVGDTTAGLTLIEAVTVYDKDGDEYEPCIFKARFDGRIKLKGILHRGKTEDDQFYPVIGGALMFIPYQSSLREAGLPVLHRNITDGKDIEPTVYFKIGSYPEEIIDPLLGDGVSAEAEVVLTDIEMHFAYSGSGYSGYSANILSTSTDAVYNTDTRTLYIPPDCKDENVGRLICKETMPVIELDENNDFYTLQDKCLFSRDMKTLYSVPFGVYDEPWWIMAWQPVMFMTYTVPDSVNYIAPNAFYNDGIGLLRSVNVTAAVTDDNINALDIDENSLFIFKPYVKTPEEKARLDELNANRPESGEKRAARLFNTDSAEWELLRKNVGDTLDGYTFSMVSTEYLDPHFYCYKEGLPELMVALDFWRWQDDERYGIPENVMLDGETKYFIEIFRINEDPGDGRYDRYMSEAKTIERRK